MIKILTARETNNIEYELEFYYDMSRQGYIRYELTPNVEEAVGYG